MKNILSVLMICIAISACTTSNQEKKMKHIGEYITGNYPDTVAKLFAPGIVSTNLHERDFAITPDGNEIYYSVMGRDYSVIVCIKKRNGEWTKPEVTDFSGSKEFMDIEPFITQDGKQFYFMSTRPEEGQEAKPGWFYQNIWVMDKLDNGWSSPRKMETPISTDKGEYFPSLTNDGTIYFTREEGERTQAIYRSKKIDGKYHETERLPDEVNASKMQFNSLIAPDESFIIVCTQLKENFIGRTDYCISFRTEDDKWSPLINMGAKVNFPNCSASAPAFSKDGKYFFFSSNKRSNDESEKYSLDQLQKDALSPQKGSLDIYWIKSDFIEELRKQYFDSIDQE